MYSYNKDREPLIRKEYRETPPAQFTQVFEAHDYTRFDNVSAKQEQVRASLREVLGSYKLAVWGMWL